MISILEVLSKEKEIAFRDKYTTFLLLFSANNLKHKVPLYVHMNNSFFGER